MAFSCDLLCRACMEPFSGNSMPLMNKKKSRKTSICVNFEELTMLKVKETDQLPQQLCLACVSELNKSFAFREKCLRTNSTLRTYLDLSEDEEDEESGAAEEIVYRKYAPSPRKVQLKAQESKEDCYEEIEVTQEMVDAAKSQNQIDDADANTDMVLEMEEISNLLNPTASSSSNVKLQRRGGTDELVFIIQDVTDGSARLIQSPTSTDIEIQDDKTQISKGNFRCSFCEMEFVRKKNFDNHMRRFHDNDDEDASPKNKRLRLQLTKDKDDKLKENLEANPEAKKCKICGALYMNEKSLKLHERRNACRPENFECDICKKVFTDRNMFKEHIENHPEEEEPEEAVDPAKKFSCNVCPRSFKMLSTLKDHLRTHTGDKPYKCTICGRCFSQNTNLKQHLRRHTQIKHFKCKHQDCTAAFVSKGELVSHGRTHTGAHPYACDQCGTTFTTSSSLLKHKRIHSGEKPYACEFCPMRFTALGTLKNHTRTHTGEKPHKCSYCSRAFTQKSDMSAHERTHTGDRPFVCKICNSAFHQSGTLKTHMKVHNKAEVTPEENEEAENE